MSDRRVFLIVLPESQKRSDLKEKIETHISKTSFYEASDGSEALQKMSNDPPHIILLSPDLPKADGFTVANSVLSNPKYKNTAIILLCPVPSTDTFVDEVVRGRVQFLADWKNNDQLSKALARSLNYHTKENPKEFNLRFLSPGDTLLKEGEKGKSVYIVQNGEMEASTLKDDKNVTLGKISRGEFVGEMAYINHEPRSADVRAITDCELIEIPMGLLDQVLFQKPAWSKALMQTLSKRVRQNNERIKS